MQKLLYIALLSCFIMACQAKQSAVNLADKTSAQNILSSYLSLNEESQKFLPSFSVCQLELTHNKLNKRNTHLINAYTCEITTEDGVKNIFVISDAPELKNEVDSNKKADQALVYIAHLTYNPQSKQLLGIKLLFNPALNKVIAQKEVLAYSNQQM